MASKNMMNRYGMGNPDLPPNALFALVLLSHPEPGAGAFSRSV
jgi:hypothetical protein